MTWHGLTPDQSRSLLDRAWSRGVRNVLAMMSRGVEDVPLPGDKRPERWGVSRKAAMDELHWAITLPGDVQYRLEASQR